MKPKREPVHVNVNDLHAHYSQLLDGSDCEYVDKHLLSQLNDIFDPGIISNGLYKMRNNKACGDSWITPDLLKVIGKVSPRVVECISDIFNYFARHGVPTDWN